MTQFYSDLAAAARGRLIMAPTVISGDDVRRHGLGSALLAALHSRAISLGRLELFGETLKHNEEMKSLARKAGFEFGRASDWRSVRFDKHLAG